LDKSITRRDFLGSTLLASGAALALGASPQELLAETDSFTGYGGVGEYSSSNGNTLPVLRDGHSIRDGRYDPLPSGVIETGETYDCVIVGGGISGLAAALFFQRQGGPEMKALVLENHPIFGGEAKQNEFLVDGQRLIAHQGSAIYQLQYPFSFLAHFYDSIGLKALRLRYQKWGGPQPELVLSRTPYQAVGLENGHYGFWFGQKFGQKAGFWVVDPLGKKLAGAPISPQVRAEWLRAGPVEFGPVLTPQGKISVRFNADTRGVNVELESAWRGSAPRREFRLAGCTPLNVPAGDATTGFSLPFQP